MRYRGHAAVLLSVPREEVREPRRDIAKCERLRHLHEMTQPLPQLANHCLRDIGIFATQRLEIRARHEDEARFDFGDSGRRIWSAIQPGSSATERPGPSR